MELPTHTGLQITFTLWKIDSWDSEGVWFYVDGQEVYGVTANWWEGLNLCYNSWWYDYAYEVIIDLPDHTSTLTYFDFYNNFDEDPYNESFGITNF